MARKVLNRKALREEADAAEKAGITAKPVKAKAEKKAPVKRKSRKEAAVVRMKLFWGVYNQALRRVALYEFNHASSPKRRPKTFLKAENHRISSRKLKSRSRTNKLVWLG